MVFANKFPQGGEIYAIEATAYSPRSHYTSTRIDFGPAKHFRGSVRPVLSPVTAPGPRLNEQVQSSANLMLKDDALKILTAPGMPRGQRNERSALTLLALLNLKPDGTWNALQKPLTGITPIMDFTRETFRRQTTKVGPIVKTTDRQI